MAGTGEESGTLSANMDAASHSLTSKFRETGDLAKKQSRSQIWRSCCHGYRYRHKSSLLTLQKQLLSSTVDEKSNGSHPEDTIIETIVHLWPAESVTHHRRTDERRDGRPSPTCPPAYQMYQSELCRRCLSFIHLPS